MIAEYERAQILERTRRGKAHRAKSSPVSTLPLPIRGFGLHGPAAGEGGLVDPPARAKLAPVLGAVKQTTLDRTCGAGAEPEMAGGAGKENGS